MPSKNTSAPKTSKAASKTASKAASKSSSSKTATKAKTASPAPAPAPAPTPVETETVSETMATPPLQEEFASVLSKLQQVTALASSLRTSVRELEKKCNREIKAAAKASQEP